MNYKARKYNVLLFDKENISIIDELKWDKADDIVKSLQKHKVSLNEVKSLEDEITNCPQKLTGTSIVVGLMTVLFTIYSNYLVMENNRWSSVISSNTSTKELSKALKEISANSDNLNQLISLIYILVVVAIVRSIMAFWRFNKKSIQLKALRRYERQLYCLNEKS